LALIDIEVRVEGNGFRRRIGHQQPRDLEAKVPFFLRPGPAITTTFVSLGSKRLMAFSTS